MGAQVSSTGASDCICWLGAGVQLPRCGAVMGHAADGPGRPRRLPAARVHCDAGAHTVRIAGGKTAFASLAQPCATCLQRWCIVMLVHVLAELLSVRMLIFLPLVPQQCTYQLTIYICHFSST